MRKIVHFTQSMNPSKNRNLGEYQRNADMEIAKNLPFSVKLIKTLRGHVGAVGQLAWSPNGELLASPSEDGTIRLWDAINWEQVHVFADHREPVMSVAFDPSGLYLASGGGFERSNSLDATIRVWEVKSGKVLYKFGDHEEPVSAVLFDPSKKMTLFSGSYDGRVKRWEVPEKRGQLFKNSDEPVFSLDFDPEGRTISVGHEGGILLCETADSKLVQKFKAKHGWATNAAWGFPRRLLASGGHDKTVKIWDVNENRLLFTCEGHTDAVVGLDFYRGGNILASKGRSIDSTVRIWNTETGACLAIIPDLATSYWYPGLAFHPSKPILAVAGSDPRSADGDRSNLIHIYELDLYSLLASPRSIRHNHRKLTEQTVHYANAKVVLVGDTGVGKSGLSLVLTNQPFKATDSTPGRRVWTFNSQEVCLDNEVRQTRETLLWDLAGQPGYRIIHQLHLNEVAVAVVVFDARSETDPLAGVRHWVRALRLAQQRQNNSSLPMKKFLVSARNDRGGVSVSKDRLNTLIDEFQFDGYFETSAKEGWQVKELRKAIEDAIEWSFLPDVSSSQLFADIKSFLVAVKKTGRLLTLPEQLYSEFTYKKRGLGEKANLWEQFKTCIGRLETRDLIRCLSFGGYILLQPELLDAYASAIVNTAKDEPDGLGSLAEEIALKGKFFVPDEQRIRDLSQEQLLLHATVEELVRHDIALRENADDGRYLVFPSQFNRDYEDAPEPRGKAISITFDGPVQSLYSTLAVRLGHSGLFTTGRTEMWRNAAVFTAKAGGKCGIFLHEFTEGRGRMLLFFDEQASSETKFHFEEFVLAHTNRRALEGSVETIRFFVCSSCGDPVPDNYVKRLKDKGVAVFNCPCGSEVTLAASKERIHFQSKIEIMDRSADRHRDFDAFIVSAKGETSTKSFQKWAGGDRVTLAIVFTDIVGSTALGEQIKDEAMNEARQAHFTQSRKFIEQFKGREIKTIGDSFMAAFRAVDAGLDYALALQKNTGHLRLQIRAGIHIGPLQVEEADVFGGTVNFAARVVGAIKEAEVWLSEDAKADIDKLGSKKHKDFQWNRHENISMKGFSGMFTLWSLKK